MCVGPDGRLLDDLAGADEWLVLHRIDLAAVRRARIANPLLRDERHDINDAETDRLRHSTRSRLTATSSATCWSGFVRNEVRKVGFERVVLGLSGGIDSALSAAIAVRGARGRRTCSRS